jgi:Skp family chaperone for outer membrane proteins
MQQLARRISFVIAAFIAIPAVAGEIGFLDTGRAIGETKEGQRQIAALNEWADQRADEVEAMRDRINQMAENINAQRTIATDEVIAGLEDDFVRAQRELEDFGRSLQRDVDVKRQELLTQVANRIRDLAGEYAEANGYDAILLFESTPLVYVNESVVITDELIRLYDQRYPIN